MPSAELPSAEAIAVLADGDGRLALRVTPGARVEGIAIVDGMLSVKVRAKPADGAANEAVLALLAKALGVPRTALVLLRGATSRQKLVRIR